MAATTQSGTIVHIAEDTSQLRLVHGLEAEITEYPEPSCPPTHTLRENDEAGPRMALPQ